MPESLKVLDADIEAVASMGITMVEATVALQSVIDCIPEEYWQLWDDLYRERQEMRKEHLARVILWFLPKGLSWWIVRRCPERYLPAWEKVLISISK